MRVFVDESGTFSSRNPGWSIMAAVAIAERDGTLERAIARLRRWERTLPRERRDGGEVKGWLLTDDELTAFVSAVLEREREKNHVTLCGFDSSRVVPDQISKFRSELAVGGTPELLRCEVAGNRRTAQTVREMIGWVKGRSDEQTVWLVCLQHVFAHALQHAVIALMDETDLELADLRFVVDRSWLKNPRHLQFWHNFLNSGLNERSRQSPLALPRHWQRDHHAFLRAYARDGGLDFRALWKKTEFRKSYQEPGVRIADVVAQIAYRHFRSGKAARAFAALERVIMGQDGLHLHAVDPTPRAML